MNSIIWVVRSVNDKSDLWEADVPNGNGAIALKDPAFFSREAAEEFRNKCTLYTLGHPGFQVCTVTVQMSLPRV